MYNLVKLVFSLSGDDTLIVTIMNDHVKFSIEDSYESERVIIISKKKAKEIRAHLKGIE